MKKLAFAIVFLAVAYVAATIFTASQLAQQQQELLEKAQEITALTLLENETSSGFFGAQGRYVVQLELDDYTRLIATLPWQAQFYPGWATWNSQAQLDVDASGQRENLGQWMGLDVFELNGQANWQKATLNYQLPLLNNSIEGVQVQLKNLAVQLSYAYSGEQSSRLSFDELQLTDRHRESLHLKGVSIQASQQGDAPWLTADWQYQIKSLRFKDAQQAFEVNNASMKMDYGLTPAQLAWRSQFAFAQFHAVQQGMVLAAVEQGNLAFKFTAQDGNKIAQTLMQVAHLEPMQLAESFLSSAPRLELDDLSFNAREPVAMEPKVQGWAALPSIQAHSLEQALAQLELELNLRNIPVELLVLLGAPLEALSAEGTYQVKVTQGMVYLNGEPVMPL